MNSTLPSAVLMLSALVAAGCGGDEPASAPATAAPASTTPADPASSAPASTEPSPVPSAKTGATGDVCKLFSKADILRGLGVPVKEPRGTTLQGTSTCIWPAAKAGDGAASITRGPAGLYDVYKPDFSGPGGPGKPKRHDLAGFGEKGHIEGTDGDSLGGRWAAIAVRGDQAFAVDITGVKVSEAGATWLLRQVLDRS